MDKCDIVTRNGALITIYKLHKDRIYYSWCAPDRFVHPFKHDDIIDPIDTTRMSTSHTLHTF